MSASSKRETKLSLRVLQFVVDAGQVDIGAFGGVEGGNVLLISKSSQARKMVATQKCLHQLHRAQLITRHANTCQATGMGEKHLKRSAPRFSDGSEYQNQHRYLESQSVAMEGERHCVSRNLHESPLSRLRLRKCNNGQPWLSEPAFSAGEKLRHDFTRGQFMASTTSNWTASMGGSHCAFGAGGKVDLSDSALDARERFNQAITHVGPDLAGVVTDVCCYLKGLQTVEREMGWPPRSAKLMLKTGLGLLVSFYGTEPGRPSFERTQQVLRRGT